MRHVVLCGMLLATCGLSACSSSSTSQSPNEEEATNSATLRLPLEGQAPDGTVYRLHHATFRWAGAGAGSATVAGRESLSVDVVPGTHALTLEPGWSIVRSANGAAYPVDAELLSSSTFDFWVVAGGSATGIFRFQIDGQVVLFGEPVDPTGPGIPQGTGGGSTGGTTGSGGGIILPIDPGDALISQTGWLDASTNTVGVSGPFWTLSDGHTSVSPLDYTAQPIAGENCMYGTTAAVQANDFSGYWGAMVGFNPNQPSPEMAPQPYDAAAHGVVGLSFRITGTTGGETLRFLAGPSQLSDGSYETYCVNLDLADCTDGCSVRFDEMHKDCWIGDGPLLDERAIDHFGWQVTSLFEPVDFAFCVSDLRALTVWK